MQKKECRQCGFVKPSGEFYRHKRSCKSCLREQRRLRYWQNPEAERVKSREHHQANPGQKKAYYKKNRAAILERQAKRHRQKQIEIQNILDSRKRQR